MLKFVKLRPLYGSLRRCASEIWPNTVCAGCVKRSSHWQCQWRWSRKVSQSRFSQITDNVVQAKRNLWNVNKLPWAAMLESTRRVTSSNSLYHPDKFDNLHLLESWNGVVNPFGRLCVSGPFNVHVSLINPHEHPEMDKAFVSIFAQKENGKEIGHCGDKVKTKIDLSDQGKLLNINGRRKEESKDGVTPPLECVLHVPVKFGINIQVEENCCVRVSDVESTDVKIKLDMGDCVLSNIRTGFVGVESVGGNIRCENTLQGNIDLKTGLEGAIHGEKFQGSQIRVQTYAGQVQIQTIYGENGIFWSNTGTIHLGSCHGDTSVDVYNGDVSIESLDGDLTAKVKTCGNVTAYLSRHEEVDISVGKGNVNIKLPDTVQSGIELTANSVDIGHGFKTSNVTTDQGPTLTTVSGHLGSSDFKDLQQQNIKVSLKKGQITVASCDWFTSVISREF